MTKKKEKAKTSASFQDIALNQIKPNPSNPRKRGFIGQAFDELVASIESKGVLQPVLARTKGKGFELVAGERRFKACCAIAEKKGTMKTATIPAMVRDLDDEAAFDVMMIENLQREDLSELEEAEGFKAWLDKRGPESLEDLAQRTGIQPGYIRRRVALLELPEKALKAWDKGKLKYGHLEVLIRIQDKKQRDEFLADAINRSWSAKELRRRIDSESPSLKKALFDLDQEGCPQCFHNTDKQKTLFALDDIASAACMKPACFKQKQNNWLSANWKACELRRKYKTNGFRFEDARNRSATGASFYPGEKVFVECKTCDKFVSLIGIDGEAIYGHSGRYCLDPKCKRALEVKDRAARTKQKKQAQQTAIDAGLEETEGEPQAEAPRVVFQQEVAQSYLFEKLLKKRGKFDACKKSELVELFLKSGADLADVVPEEILRKPEQPPIYEQDNEEPTCRVCGCTEDDSTECIEVTGHPCHWFEPDLCSRCASDQNQTATEAA